PPMPFKVFVLASGVLGFPYLRFVLTLFLARSVRYAFWGSMGAAYGEEARSLLHAFDAWGGRHWPLLVSFLAVLALTIVRLARRRRARGPADPDVDRAA